MTTAQEYYEWRKFIRAWSPELPKLGKAQKSAFGLIVLRSVALAIADHGKLGKNCFAGNTVIADEVPCSRQQVFRVKRFLVEQGLLALTGEKRGRVEVVDISIPSSAPVAPALPTAAYNGDQGQGDDTGDVCSVHGYLECWLCKIDEQAKSRADARY